MTLGAATVSASLLIGTVPEIFFFPEYFYSATSNTPFFLLTNYKGSASALKVVLLFIVFRNKVAWRLLTLCPSCFDIDPTTL